MEILEEEWKQLSGEFAYQEESGRDTHRNLEDAATTSYVWFCGK